MKTFIRTLFSAVSIVVLTIGFMSCGSKKHSNCESYGNKAGYVEVPTEQVPS